MYRISWIQDFTGPGTTQGILVSPTLFNVVVDNVIRTCLSVTVEDHRVARDGLGKTVGDCFGVFYADDGMVSSRDADWLQHAINVLVGLFIIYGPVANVANFTQDYMPARSITGRDVGGGRGAEMQACGRLVPSETPTADTMPRV